MINVEAHAVHCYMASALITTMRASVTRRRSHEAARAAGLRDDTSMVPTELSWTTRALHDNNCFLFLVSSVHIYHGCVHGIIL